MITLYEHPLSPYAQKCKIALREKAVDFALVTPDVIGSGRDDVMADFLRLNPRAEVPALVDGETCVYDSTVILEYIEDRWPSPPLLPPLPAERARARILEDVCDTHYDAINWGAMEILVFKRATGDLADKLLGEAARQATGLNAWLERHLGGREWMNGAAFGWADLSVIPYVNGAAAFGNGPRAGSALASWQERVNARPSVAQTTQEATASMAGIPDLARVLAPGVFVREYRDHRLEWMIRSGGLSIVTDGMEKGTIRFSREMS
ncbi:MAG TPA: glutathione S-transferase family protein [Candidatus Limnocylindrales bacterium]|nr:glutathione S-transferase family protein [Candidatus Limnocylindrales bacterium]